MDTKRIKRMFQKVGVKTTSMFSIPAINNGHIATWLRKTLDPDTTLAPQFREYMLKCLPWKDGATLDCAHLCGRNNTYPRFYPTAQLVHGGFFLIGKSGKKGCTDYTRGSFCAILVDLTSDAVYWVNIQKNTLRAVTVIDEKTKKRQVIRRFSRDSILPYLTPLANSLEEFLLGLLNGEYDGRLRALDPELSAPEKAREAVEGTATSAGLVQPGFGVLESPDYWVVEKLVLAGKLAGAAKHLETKLRSMPDTPFHAILGTSLLGQTDKLAAWLESEANTSRKHIKLKTMHCGIGSDFELNPDADYWKLRVFSFEEYGGLKDLDWLAYFDHEPNRAFSLSAFSAVRKAFAKDCRPEELEAYETAGTLTMLLFLVRIMEGVQAAAKPMKKKGGPLHRVHVVVSAYDWSMVYEVR